MKKISGLNDDDLAFLKRMILKRIELIDEEYIQLKNWELASKLANQIDEYDIPFVALCLELKCFLWTGDKKLINGLKKQEMDWVLDTQNLLEIRNN